MVSALIVCLLTTLPQNAKPVAHWLIQESRYLDGEVIAATGPNLMVSGFPKSIDHGYEIKEEGECFVYPWDDRSKWPKMPQKDFTISVRFSVPDDKGTQGLVGCIFEPKEGLQGWRVVIKDGKPELTLAKPGHPAAIIRSKEALKEGVPHRLDASYDGTKLRLYIDGALKGEAEAKFGNLVYNGRAGICFADWWEGPRIYMFRGSLFEAALFDQALTPDAITSSLKGATVAPMPSDEGKKLEFTIDPFFQNPTMSEATVVWETSRIASTLVRVGTSAKTAKEIKSEDARIHQVSIQGLEPAKTYFVQTESRLGNEIVTSKWASFRTASLPGTGVKLAIVGDTQDHPEANTIVAKAVFAERPDAAMIVGDLVGMGWKKDQWKNDFFASMRPMFNHVPLLPVMGNHDRNARIYYDLMAVPQPEYCYSYRTGDLECFVIDTNRDVRPGSVQYKWLESALQASTARWKIAAHHHPPYSSDNDDFGDSMVEQTTDGELDVRPLTLLYDKYGVDMCFAGHIHSYERTYPIRAGKAVEEGKGTVYMIVGGGGGDLETPKPTRSQYSRVVRTGHHFSMIWVDANRFELRGYDDQGRLFDTYVMVK